MFLKTLANFLNLLEIKNKRGGLYAKKQGKCRKKIRKK